MQALGLARAENIEVGQLAHLMGSFYLTCVIFVALVLGLTVNKVLNSKLPVVPRLPLRTCKTQLLLPRLLRLWIWVLRCPRLRPW